MMNVHDTMKSIVDKTHYHYADDEKSVEFMMGHVITVVNRLNEKVNSKAYSFPLIAFYRPFKESVTTNKDGTYEVLFPKVVIATPTKHELLEEQRIEVNFKPILYPVLESFLFQLKKDKRIASFSIKSKIDVPYYSEDGQKSDNFNQCVDGIILENLRLFFNKNYCIK